MNEIIQWSATQTATNIRNGTASCVEVAEAHLQQMEHINPALNAVVECAPDQVMKQANLLDQNKPGTGELPPLYGVPITTKINVDQIGSCTSNGIPAFNIHPATTDAPMIANLKRDGALILGRTSTPEFSIRWFTSNPIYGVSHNPWHPDYTPGGSSGAAAAAVAAGIGSIAHGNDLGGSLRYPAYCCGVATIRPSMGRVPAGNSVDRPALTQHMSVNGPIARNIADVRLGLTSMARRDSRDPLWNNSIASGRQRQHPWKIAWFTDLFGDGVDPAVADAVQKSAEALQAAGHELIETPPPQALEAATVWGNLLFTETLTMAMEAIKEHGSAEVYQLAQSYGQCYDILDVKGLLAAMQQRLALQRAWEQFFDEFDAVLLPVSGQKPFLNDLDFKQPEGVPELMKAQRFLYIINLLGLPSAAVPVGIYDELPVGVQLVGAMHDDLLCLDIAEELERELQFSGWLARN